MLELFQYASNETLNLYKSRGKEFYEFSIKFCIALNFICWGATVLVMLTAGYFFYNDSSAFEKNFFDLTQLSGQTGITRSAAIICFGLYAVYIDRITEENFAEAIGFKDFLRCIFKEDWLFLAALLVVQMILETLTFKPLSSFIGEGNNNEHWLAVIGFLQKLIYFFNTYVAYFFAALILLRSNINRLTSVVLKNYKTFVVASVVLLFAVYSLSNSIYWIVQYLLYPLIEIPFGQSAVGMCIKFFLVIVIPSVFYPAFASAIYFPFIHHYRYLNLLLSTDEAGADSANGIE